MQSLIVQYDIVILIRLILAHMITDFILQPKNWVADRINKKHRSKYLYIHGAVTALVAYILLGDYTNFWAPATILITHILIDLWKAYQPNDLKFFILDQFLHFLVLLSCWLIIIDFSWADTKVFNTLLNNYRLWVIVLGYTIVIWPMAFFIQFATKKWRDKMAHNGLEDAGKWIGYIERTLVMTFVLLNQFQAIGFLIAAKSIFRFSGKNESKDREEAEYILIGTLLSFALSIISGIVIRMLVFS